MIINHNIPALNTYNKLFWNNAGMAKSLEKLSSGLRINRAADDAAGLAISEKMRAQIRGLEMAMRNAQDGISLVQTAEGALAENHAILQRMRELAVQAANDTYTSNDRMEIQREIDQLKDEINRISASTQFNAKNLLDGTTSALVSTDKLTTKVFMRGELRQVDQFGQKAPGGGNYRLNIYGEAGAGQVQKSDIFKVKHAGENALGDTDLGYARFDAVGANSMTAGESITFTFDIDGDPHSITYTTIDTATVTEWVAGAVAAINANTATAGIIQAKTGAAGAFVIERIDAPDQAMDVSWEMSSASPRLTAEGVGPASAGATTVDATAQNIISFTANASTLLAGNYFIDTQLTSPATADSTSVNYTREITATLQGVVFSTSAATNASVLLEATSVDALGVASFSYQYTEVTKGGVATTTTGTLSTISTGDPVIIGSNEYTLTFTSLSVGDKLLINASPSGADTTEDQIRINHSADGTTMAYQNYRLNHNGFNTSAMTFNFFQLDSDRSSLNYGKTTEAEVTITFGALRDTTSPAGLQDAATFAIEEGNEIGRLANPNSRLYDIDRFWDASGNFILEVPQTIHIVQGNGEKTSVTLFGSDTIQDVVDKINEAIGDGLAQNELDGMTTLTDRYVSYVTSASDTGLDAVDGTLVIRTARTGQDGELLFMGDDATINALSLTQIQASRENKFRVDVNEAHSGAIITAGYKLEDNTLVGVIHPNVDVKFDPNTGVQARWDTAANTFIFDGIVSGSTTYVHIADRSMIFHIGANPLQDIAAGIGNMSAEALGINGLMVTSNLHANRAIRSIDSAIGKVSIERSKLGAIQNRLDHTISNLSTTTENLVASESRIRDVDMAKEMMNFTRYNILSQAATAMLAQANQLPQTVLQLLR